MSASPSDASMASSTSSNDSLSSLNSQLLSHGWAKRPLNLDALGERDLSEVISVFFELLGSSITNIDNLDALNSRHRTLQYEHERTQKALTASRIAERKAEVEASGWRSRVKGLEKKLGEEEGKVRELREEAARGRKALEGVRLAASHDSKRLQVKLDQANTKLTKLANDSSLMTKASGMLILNPIPQTRCQPVVTGQAPLLEQSLRDLAAIRQSLEEETEAFRHVVVSTGNLLRETIAASSGNEAPHRLHHSHFFSVSSSSRSTSSSSSSSIQAAPSISHPQIASERLQALITTLRTKLEAKIIRIPVGEGILPPDPEELEAQARLEREKEKDRQDLVDRLKDLEIEVECARGREEEAKKSLDEYVKRQMQETMDKAAERDHDTSDLLDVLREREKLEDERRQMIDAMSRFSNQRRIFERERLSFMEERRRVDVDDVLAQLPTMPLGPSGSASSSSGSIVAVAVGTSNGQAVSAMIDLPEFDLPSSSWNTHQPHSPSPLSPHRPRTPKAHMAKGKRAKTPLSRIVLEKAIRRKSMGLVAEQEAIAAPGTREVLGEGSKRTNASASASASVSSTSKTVTSASGSKASLAQSSKGKERARNEKDRLAGSTMRTTIAESRKLGQSTGAAGGGLGLGGSKVKVDLGASSSRASGAAARNPKTKVVWR